MARKTDRNFLADFAALDIEYLPEKGPEVSSDIQMVYVMGDVTPAAAAAGGFTPGFQTPNPILAEYAVAVTLGAVAGQNGVIELLAVAGGGGIWVDFILGTTTAVNFNLFSIAALSGLANRILPTAANSSAFGDGRDATAIFDHGNIVRVVPVNTWRSSTGAGATSHASLYEAHNALWIGPGRVFVAQMFTANLAATAVGLKWREIP